MRAVSLFNMSMAMRAAAVMYAKQKKKKQQDTGIEGFFDKEDPNEKRKRVQRQINAAVSEENYREAARLKKMSYSYIYVAFVV